MLCIALCAFREPFEGGFVEAVRPGQEVAVPDALVDRLATDGHIERPKPAAAEPVPEPEPAPVADPIPVVEKTEPEPDEAPTTRPGRQHRADR